MNAYNLYEEMNPTRPSKNNQKRGPSSDISAKDTHHRRLGDLRDPLEQWEELRRRDWEIGVPTRWQERIRAVKNNAIKSVVTRKKSVSSTIN